MIPYDIFRMASVHKQLTEEETAEYAQLKEQLDNALHGPAADFPWHRWKELNERQFLANLPEDRPSRKLFREIQAAHKELSEWEERLELWPVTNVNVDAHHALMDQIERKRRLIDFALDKLGRMIEQESALFGPVNAGAVPSPAAKPVVSAPKPHSLLRLCLGTTQGQRQAQAELIDEMLDAAKQGVGYEAERYATACVAVYKLAEHLKLVEEGTKSTIWVPLLEEQYGVTVTEGRAKYSFNKPQKPVFIKAVRAAYAVYSKRYPHKAKDRQLPSGY